MAKEDDIDVDTDAYVRRSTVMTGLIDFSLFTTTALLMKNIVEDGPDARHYYLLVSMTSLLLIVQLALLVLAALIYGPKTLFPVPQVEKIMHLRIMMDQFRSYYTNKWKICYPTRLDDDDVFVWLASDKVVDKEKVTYKKKYYEKIIKDYKNKFPTEKVKDDAVIWLELKDNYEQYKRNAESFPAELNRTREHIDNLNDAISVLSAIVLALMIFISAFTSISKG